MRSDSQCYDDPLSYQLMLWDSHLHITPASFVVHLFRDWWARTEPGKRTRLFLSPIVAFPPHQTIMSSKQGWPLTWPPLSPSFVSLCSSLDLDLSGWFRWEVEAPEAAKGWQEGVRWGAHAFLIRSITLSLVCWILKTLGMSGLIGFSWWLAWLKALSVSNLYDSRILDGFDASV